MMKKTESVFLPPFGYCQKLTMKKDTITITTSSSTFFRVVDPRKENELRTPRLTYAKGSFGPNGNNSYDGYTYVIEISIHDSRNEDGISCNDYEKNGTSYGECIEKSFHDYLVNAYGCLPPWFPKHSNMTCEEHVAIKTMDEKTYVELNNVISRFISYQRLQPLEACLPPCVSMHLKLLEIQRIPIQHNAFAKFEIIETVKVSTDVYAYDMFSLVVDLGSALGLWLGLSALSIFDLIVDSYKTAKHVISMVSKKD